MYLCYLHASHFIASLYFLQHYAQCRKVFNCTIFVLEQAVGPGDLQHLCCKALNKKLKSKECIRSWIAIVKSLADGFVYSTTHASGG